MKPERQLEDTQRQLVAVKGERAEFRRKLRNVTREREPRAEGRGEALTSPGMLTVIEQFNGGIDVLLAP